MATNPILDKIDSMPADDVRSRVFNAFHAEGCALLPHDMLKRIVTVLKTRGTSMSTRNAVAAELAKLAPGLLP